MKKALIVTLLGLNIALLVALVLGANSPEAKAQVAGVRKYTDYIMITGHMSTDVDAVYVVDMATKRLAAWKFDKTRKRLIRYRVRDLGRDFEK